MEEAKKIFYNLIKEKQLEPDHFTFNTLIKGCVKNKNLESAIEYFDFMKSKKIKPNRIIYNSLMDLSVKLENMK